MSQKLDWKKLLAAAGELVSAAGAEDAKAARAAAKKIDAVMRANPPKPPTAADLEALGRANRELAARTRNRRVL